MLKNYLKIALRNLRKHTGYAFINIFGLALGLAVCLLILLYVRDEVRYDRFHEKAERLYRVLDENDAGRISATPEAPLAPALVQNYPEVEAATRLFRYWFTPLVSRGDEGFYERDILFTDPSFFEVFSFPLVRGTPATALTAPSSIVLTESSARKYFGEEDPLGQTLTLNATFAYTVTGVVQDPPRTSHFQFDFLASLESIEALMNWPHVLEEWNLGNFHTYVVLPAGYDPAALDAKLVAFVDQQFGEEAKMRFFLQPLTDIHFYSHYSGELEANGDVRYVWLLAGIALIILLLACINYTNLATARFARRTREVGIRKVVGAHRSQLTFQFLGESVWMAGLAYLVALALLEALVPTFGALLGEPIAFSYFADAGLLALLAVIALAAGLLAGSYPAFYLAKFHPGAVLKGSFAGPRRTPLRTVLVVSQYAMAVVLLAGAGIVYRQLDYVQTKKLGFEREQVVVIPVRDEALRAQPSLAKATLQRVPGVQLVSANTSLPGTQFPGTTDVQRPGVEIEPFRMSLAWGDAAYLETLGMRLVAGRSFSEDYAADSVEAVLLNQAATRALGWAAPEEALGERLEYWGETREVIGVIEDFHYASLREPIGPMVLMPEFEEASGLVVRTNTDDLPATLAGLEAAWKSLTAAQPFTYSFLDQDLEKLYVAEARWGRVIGSAALFALLIACLGLFGLASFTAQQRTKEIGVRKVLGASAGRIALLLSQEYARLVVIAFVVGTPVALFAAQRWLDGFAYRVTLAQCAGIFLAAGAGALAIALLTVSYQAVRAALADPVESLRYE